MIPPALSFPFISKHPYIYPTEKTMMAIIYIYVFLKNGFNILKSVSENNKVNLLVSYHIVKLTRGRHWAELKTPLQNAHIPSHP